MSHVILGVSCDSGRLTHVIVSHVIVGVVYISYFSCHVVIAALNLATLDLALQLANAPERSQFTALVAG